MIVSLYGRVSTADKGQEVEIQLSQLREYADKESWSIYHEYVDRKTGASPDRPQFKQMMLDARNRKFDLVLFWSLDRFSREGTLRTLQYLQLLRDYKVGFRSYKEPYIDTLGPFSDVVISLLATIAEFERKRFGERVKAGIDQARKRGSFRTGRPIVIVDKQRILDLRKEGLSIRRIAKELKIGRQIVFNRLKGE